MRRLPAWLMLGPYLFGLIALVLLPAVASGLLAFTDWDLLDPPRFSGLDNARELGESLAFQEALLNSLSFAVFAVPLRVLIALASALLLARPGIGVGTARVSVVLPMLIPEIALGLVWLWMFNPIYGPINQVLSLGATTPGRTGWGGLLPQWLTSPPHARIAIIIMCLFTVGEMFLIMLATRKLLPEELYEAAVMEGASPWQIMRRVTLPLMAPVIGLLTLRDIILSLQVSFVPALVVTDGGPPQYATTYLSLYVYRTGFEYLHYGLAAAASLLMLLLTALAVWAQWRLLPKGDSR